MKKVGILGGGQLGRMLLQSAINYPVETYLMENNACAPAAHLCHHFILGEITNFEDVYNFGKELDVITIEIENVNVDALEKLEKEGVIIYPKTSALRTIKNKVKQKLFYQKHQIPTSEFVVTENKADLIQHESFIPAVHKLAEGGYDGKGVQIIQNKDDFNKGFDAPAVLEKKVPILRELSVIIAVNNKMETAIYPVVEMIFDNQLNLLHYQISPANIPQKILWKAEAISLTAVKNLQSPGLFACELFVDIDDNVLINEIAPRVHNSGHHTIEGNYSSQFDMLWRIMLDYPLGNTSTILPSAMLNVVGASGFTGIPIYKGLEEVLKMDNVFVHLYGKKETKPGRKMGHITIISNEKQELIHKVNQIKNILVVEA